jgi:hypothetical protein
MMRGLIVVHFISSVTSLKVDGEFEVNWGVFKASLRYSHDFAAQSRPAIEREFTMMRGLSGPAAHPSIEFGNAVFATLDGTSPDDRLVGCQGDEGDFLPVPSGWAIAPNEEWVRNVIASHPWGTHELVLVDGSQYETALSSNPGKKGTWHGDMPATALGTDGHGRFRVNACNRRILIVQASKTRSQTAASAEKGETIRELRLSTSQQFLLTTKALREMWLRWTFLREGENAGICLARIGLHVRASGCESVCMRVCVHACTSVFLHSSLLQLFVPLSLNSLWYPVVRSHSVAVDMQHRSRTALSAKELLPGPSWLSQTRCGTSAMRKAKASKRATQLFLRTQDAQHTSHTCLTAIKTAVAKPPTLGP